MRAPDEQLRVSQRLPRGGRDYASTPSLEGFSGNSFSIVRVPGNGAAWTDLTISVQLTADLVSSVSTSMMLGAPASGVPALGESLVADVFTAYFSANCTTGKCTVAAITLALEPA